MNYHEVYHETKAHTTPDFPYNTYLCSIPLDFPEVKAHWHNEAELIVIQKGSGIVEVDLHAHVVQEGDFVLILPGQLHAIRQKAPYTMEYENIIFDPVLLDMQQQDLCASMVRGLFAGMHPMPVVLRQNLPYYPGVSACIRRMDALCSEQPAGYQLSVKANLLQLCFFLLTYHQQSAEQQQKKKTIEKVKIILSYVAEHYQESITIAEAAAVCHYSTSHFMKFFRAAMGEGFIQYLNQYRMRVASRLLLTTSDSILEIAMAVGIENLSYFNRQFKKQYGISPGQYRKNG
jgi:AraC-like DNA-binding protein/mannose-6-phosphate isomerase-like protein (cupin superfamily)